MPHLISLIILALLAPCGASSFSPASEEGADPPGAPAMSSDLEPETAPSGHCEESGEVVKLVLGRVSYGRDPAEGFDLDDRASASGDPRGCGHADGPDGVDNGLATEWAHLSDLAGYDLEALYDRGYETGDIALGLKLEGVDSLTDDDCVRAEVLWLFKEDPELAGESGYVPGQEWVMFNAHGVMPARIRDGVLDVFPAEGSGFELNLADDATGTGGSGFFVSNARIRLVFGEGATLSGTVSASQLEEWVVARGGHAGRLGERADLDGPDGACTAISLTLTTGPEAPITFERDRL